MKDFTELYNLDVSKMIETIKKTTKTGEVRHIHYLSWAYAFKFLKINYPESSWITVNYPDKHGNLIFPYLSSELGFFVTVELFLTKEDRVNNFGHRFTHPVLDNRNNPIQSPNSFQINTSIMRGLTKLIGMVTGIGLSLYSGEDIPRDSDNGDSKPSQDNVNHDKDIKETKVYQTTKTAFKNCYTELDLNLALNNINNWLKGKGQSINPDWVIDLYKDRFESLPKEIQEPTEKPETYLSEVKKSKSDIRRFLEDCEKSEDVRLLYEAYQAQIEADVLLKGLYKAQCDKFQVKIPGSDVAEKALKELG